MKQSSNNWAFGIGIFFVTAFICMLPIHILIDLSFLTTITTYSWTVLSLFFAIYLKPSLLYSISNTLAAVGGVAVSVNCLHYIHVLPWSYVSNQIWMQYIFIYIFYLIVLIPHLLDFQNIFSRLLSDLYLNDYLISMMIPSSLLLTLFKMHSSHLSVLWKVRHLLLISY